MKQEQKDARRKRRPDMQSMLYKVAVITVSAIGVNLVDAGMKLWDTGYYGASVLGFTLASASYFGAACLMDMFAKSKGGK